MYNRSIVWSKIKAAIADGVNMYNRSIVWSRVQAHQSFVFGEEISCLD